MGAWGICVERLAVTAKRTRPQARRVGAKVLPSQSLSSPDLIGRSSTPRPIGSIADASGILGAPVKPGHDGGEYVKPRSRDLGEGTFTIIGSHVGWARRS